MRAVVTGAAGFVGSHLCAHLLSCGDEVIGIDMFTDYYDPVLKERNLTLLRNFDAFSFHRVDLLDAPLSLILEGAEVIYHLAGQPGVRSSWDHDFPQYVTRNVLATHAILEAARGRSMRKMVFASSALRGDEAGSRAPVRAVPDDVGSAHRLAAPVQRVWAATTSRHGFFPTAGGCHSRSTFSSLWRR